MTSDGSTTPDEDTLRAIEALALDLARETGAIATAGLAREIEVDYKTESKVDGQAPRDPVSEIDREVEALIRERVSERFPSHDIIGEEVELHPTNTDGYVWVIDPVDGTANFVNGYPLFCVSIGILHDGEPVVGAIWCASTHALHPGVYHAHRGGGLHFDAEPFEPIHAPGVRRKLSAAPGGSPGRARDWDNRVTGSAAIELAFVAAGIFQSARFGGVHIWDLAAGVLLVQEAGGQALIRRDHELVTLERFEAPTEVKEDREPSLRDWRGLVVVGTDEAITTIRETAQRPGWFKRLSDRVRRKRRR
ncbi:MAG: inositol-1-monophosphatase [Dehalococcoidia bacterium]|jgi:myo-inositol-1(or 4)-monophosphatase|nr:inositol-1-monophosphatase [Dehalococcoidia bacterium]